MYDWPQKNNMLLKLMSFWYLGTQLLDGKIEKNGKQDIGNYIIWILYMTLLIINSLLSGKNIRLFFLNSTDSFKV